MIAAMIRLRDIVADAHPVRAALLLFVLGMARGLVILLAYPPAHGADSFVYFLYAENFAGAPNDFISQTGYPLYPTLLYASFYAAGSVYWLMALQWLMAAAVAPLYFLALVPFNRWLACAAGLVILMDFQVAIVFQFTSTEPLYIFLLALCVWLAAGVLGAGPVRNWQFMALGAVLALLMLTRPVGRFLIVPAVVLVALRWMEWRKPLMIFAAFAAVLIGQQALLAFTVSSGSALTAGDSMLANIMNANPQWLSADNGPNSAIYVQAVEDCDEHPFRCLQTMVGEWDAALRVVSGAASETVRAHLPEVLAGIVRKTSEFLMMSGQQYAGPDSPAIVQCARPTPTATRDMLMKTTWGWALPSYDAATLARITAAETRVRAAMCPPLVAPSAHLKDLLDTLAERYRSIGRPNALVWYAAILAGVLALPWLRRSYLWLALLLLAFLMNHALISAVTFNVQPRYVVVVNPLREILLLMLLGGLVSLVLRASAWIRRRISSE